MLALIGVVRSDARPRAKFLMCVRVRVEVRVGEGGAGGRPASNE